MGWNRTGSLINRYKITEELLSGAFRIPCEFNFQILNYESRYQYFVSGNSRCDGIYLFFSRRVYFFVWRRQKNAGKEAEKDQKIYQAVRKRHEKHTAAQG